MKRILAIVLTVMLLLGMSLPVNNVEAKEYLNEELSISAFDEIELKAVPGQLFNGTMRKYIDYGTSLVLDATIKQDSDGSRRFYTIGTPKLEANTSKKHLKAQHMYTVRSTDAKRVTVHMINMGVYSGNKYIKNYGTLSHTFEAKY